MDSEKSERKYLERLQEKIDHRFDEINEAINLKKKEISEMDTHMQEHKRDMDHLEKNALRETITNYQLVGNHAVDSKKRLFRLRDTAYFGRIDFKNKGETRKIYVGVHNFQDEENNQNLVYDWRAPISSMFYDYELGEAGYDTIEERVEGEINLKRQFRIRKGKMEYMIESDMHIHDDVLQKELARASSDKMKNIVATIQKEQNAIIRNEEAHNLVIQGVAGSGKTSIALHRIAFMLYRFKETISSKDILIISPNRVFANYISNVLPELGEETVDEISMELLANQVLEYKIKFQSFFEQVSELLEKNDPKLIERIQFKASTNLLRKLDEFLLHLENHEFKPEDIIVKRYPVPAWFIKEQFQKYSRLPMLKRFNEVVREIVGNVFRYYGYEVTGKERTDLHKTVRKMFPSVNTRVLYKQFYKWLGKPELLKIRKGSIYEWADVYPFIYLTMRLEGIPSNTKVKHLVIDEMQDYTAVQYKVLSRLFACKKTILGDINQSVNPFSSSNLESIQSVFPSATCMTMLKSYRSTWEIVDFSKKVNPGTAVEGIERHGETPEVHSFKNQEDEIAFVHKKLGEFNNSSYNSLGIICKTQAQSDAVFQELKDDFPSLKLMDAGSTTFSKGAVVTTAHLAKGLEFDTVFVPFCSDKNYRTEPDRQMLYIACTRAMHELGLSYSKSPSGFLPI